MEEERAEMLQQQDQVPDWRLGHHRLAAGSFALGTAFWIGVSQLGKGAWCMTSQSQPHGRTCASECQVIHAEASIRGS